MSTQRYNTEAIGASSEAAGGSMSEYSSASPALSRSYQQTELPANLINSSLMLVTVHNASSNDCQIMDSVASSPQLIAMLAIHWIFSAVSVPALLATAVKINRFELLHRNTRIILLVYIISFTINSLSRVILFGNNLISYALPRASGCEILPSLIRCFFMRFPFNYSMFMIASSTTMIAVERSLSTAMHSNYEENKKIGPALVAIQLIFVACLVYILYYNTVFSGKVVYYCLATTIGSPWFTYVPFGTLGIIQVVAAFVLYVLKKVNENTAVKLRENPNLRERYNVDENLRTITIVLPFCVATCVFTSSFFMILICVIAINQSTDYPTLFTLIDGSLLLQEFALLLPKIIDRMTRKVAKQKQVSFQHHMTTTMEAVGNSYFSSLISAWNTQK